MITDPQTAPASRAGRRIYAISDRSPVGAADRAADDRVRGEGGAARDAHDRVRGPPADPACARGDRAPPRRRSRPGFRRPAACAVRRSAAAGAMVGAACFAGLVVVAGSPARSLSGVSSASMASGRRGQHRVDPGARDDRPGDRDSHRRRCGRRPSPCRSGAACAQRHGAREVRRRELPRRPANADRPERGPVDHGAELSACSR